MLVKGGPVDSKPALVQELLAWFWTGNKPLPEPMMAHSINAYV